jgi:hypothetical protein
MDPGPISFILLSPVYFTRILLSLSTRYAHTLCFKQTGEIDNLIVSWEQSIWLCCVQVPHCCSQSKAWTRHPINCPERSHTSGHHLQSFGSFLSWTINLGFLLRENLAAIFITPSSWGFQQAGHLLGIKDLGPISFIFLSPVYFTRTVYFTCKLLSLFTRYTHTLCFKQTGEIDNLIVSWEQSIWLCCVQVPRWY